MNSEVVIQVEKLSKGSSLPERQDRYPQLCLVVGILGAFLLLGMILLSPSQLVYDEGHPLVTLAAAEKHGWAQAFRETVSASGPLEPFVQGLLKPLTGLKPLPMRLVNALFCAGLFYLLFRIARTLRLPQPVLYAFAPLCLPPFWPPAGMALTEMPFLFFFLWFCLITVRYLSNPERCSISGSVASGCLAGLLLGVACLGRQTGLVAVGGLLLASAARREDRIFALSTIITLLLATGWLFLMWGGLVPPAVRTTHSGSLRFDLLAVGLGYLGAISLFAAPRFLLESSRWVVAIAGLVFVCCCVKPLAEFFPARGLAERLLSPSFYPGYQRLAGAAMTGFGVLVLARLVQMLWEQRANRATIFLAVTTLLFAISPVKIATFSSRYVVPAGLLLLLLVWKKNTLGTALGTRMVAGFLLGAAMLYSYYKYSIGS